jgi:6-phosphogluconolactonase (cycloisomerase 2 family)
MTTLATRAAAGATGVAASLLLALPAQAAPAHPSHSGAPVFVLNDNPTANAVIAYDRTATGALVEAGRYPTGGTGGVLAGSVVDHTASQGALAYDRTARVLYAVNPGSDTVTSFTVAGDRLVRHQVLSSGGAFPVSVAVHGNQVYVLNARDGGSVQGYIRVGGRLVLVPGWHRDLGLDTRQTPEFASTPGQVAFSPDGRHLLVTTKNGGNSIDVFAVGPLGPSATPTVNPLPGTVPFAVAFDGQGHVAVTEVGPNVVATFALGGDGRLTPLAQAATGQKGTCWVVAAGGELYASNTGSGTVSAYAVAADGALTAGGVTPTGAGTVDASVSSDGRFLYVQAGAAGEVDTFRIGAHGTLAPLGSVIVPGAAGGEGIVAL